MKILVLGATGATGSKVVDDLINQDHQVVALVRNTHKLEPRTGLTLLNGTALSLGSERLGRLLGDVDGVISCLGHNLTLRGMFGAPRMLVRDSLKRIVAHTSPDRPHPLKLVLMNSSGVRNLDQSEPISFGQHLVLGLIRILVPPHLDNERAANFLRTECADLRHIQWVSVRPDSLVDEEVVSDYELHPAPIRSALFDAGKVSRINVANFISRLVREDELWSQWQGRMPVVYNTH